MVFTKYGDKLPEVLEYYDKKLNNHFIYYHFRNDSLISKVYIVDNSLIHNEANKVTNIDRAKKIMDSLKIEYDDQEKEKNEILLRNKFNYKLKSINGQQVFLINHTYPMLITLNKSFFSVEVFYNKVNNDYLNSNQLEN